MIRLATLTAVLAVALFAGTAQAAPLTAGGVTRAEVVRWLQDKGYKANLHNDDHGASIVSSASDGVNWDIYFFVCSDAGRCASLQYAAGWDGLTLKPDTLSTWNRTKRYIRSYATADGDVWGEYDIDLSPGGTTELLDHSLDRWTGALSDFKAHIGQ